jgi:Family of unknown function (DUF5906)
MSVEFAKRLSPEDALRVISDHIASYLQGGTNCKAEDLKLAEECGLNVESVTARWASVEAQEAEAAEMLERSRREREPLEACPIFPSENVADLAVEWDSFLESAGKALAAGVSLEALEAIAAEERWVLEPGQLRAALEARGLFICPETQPGAEFGDQYQSNEYTEPKPAEERIKLPVAAQSAAPTMAECDQVLKIMNAQHAIIDNVGGRSVIACWEPSPLDPTRQTVVFQTKESFLLRYSNRCVSTEMPDGRGGFSRLTVPIGIWWLSHPRRRQFRGVTFLPAAPKVVHGCLNQWQGWGIEPRLGDWRLIREHIEVVLADGNKEFADYIVRWIAWAIQNPAAAAEVALVLIGAKGTGKGTLVRCLQRIFGAHAFQVTTREQVIGKFNGHLQDCVLFVADEAYWGGDKRCVGSLQGMITEPTLPIERKGLDVIQVKNFLHVVMLAEPGWVIPAGRFERRYAALAVSSVRRGDRAYFRELHQQIDEGGAEAMFYDLQRMDLGAWHPREIPDAMFTNPAMQKQQSHTLPPLEQWYIMLLHNGVLPGAIGGRPSTAFTKALIDDARSKIPRLRDLTEVALRNFLVDEESIGIACTKYRTNIGNGWTFPPLAEAREAWCRRYGPLKWDSPVEDWSFPAVAKLRLHTVGGG